MNPKRDSSVNKEEINRIDTRSIFFNTVDGSGASRSGGIVANNFGSDGKVTLSVYLYDETKSDGKGDKIYSCYSVRNSENNDDYVEQADQITINDPLIPDEGKAKTVLETDIISRLQAIYAAPDQKCKEWVGGHMNWATVFKGTAATAAAGCPAAAGGVLLLGGAPIAPAACVAGGIAGGASGFFSSLYFAWEPGKYTEYGCAKRYLPVQPIIAELTVKNASVQKVKIPGVPNGRNTADAAVLFGYMESFSVAVKVNGVRKAAVIYPQTAGDELPTVDAKIGDEVTFEIDAASNKIAPRIKGMPDVWIARFAGEALYYCSPSITPGEYKPFLGFDSQVHGTAIRKHPPDWKQQNGNYDLKIPAIQQKTQDNGRTLYTWSWTVSREMDANKQTYSPIYTWNKSKTSPVTQRNNQREGLNMELLQAWKDWGLDDESTFSDPSLLTKKYIYGFDPDEILYMHLNKPSTLNTPAPSPKQVNQSGLYQIEEEPWKKVLEGDKSPLNMMVNPYFKNRTAVLDGLKYTKQYEGYEIQDVGTDATHPNGTGNGNVKAPGLITINLFNDMALRIKLNVAVTPSILPDAKNGFYNRIYGTQWPAVNERNVPYKIFLPPNASPNQLSKYYLQYDYEDNLGILKSVVVNASDTGVYSPTNGAFTANFNIQGWGYHTVTAYYRSCLSCKAVPIAGKELMDVGLRFVNLSIKDVYKDNKDGAYIYLEEYRDAEADGNDYSKRYGRYVDKYNREYTFKLGDHVTVDVFDSDPHTMQVPGIEWYLSERAQAKRITNDSLKLYLTTTLSGISPGNLNNSKEIGKGRSFDFVSPSKGKYELKSSYRKTSNVYHLISSENYTEFRDVDNTMLARKADYITESGSFSGTAANTNRLLNLMGILDSGEPATDYIIGQLRFTYSTFMFKDGPRSNNAPHINRFGRYNDYKNEIIWELIDAETGTEITNYSGKLSSFISTYGTTNNHNDINSWHPDIWLRHYSDDKTYPGDIVLENGKPKYLFTDEEMSDMMDFHGIFSSDLPEPWQLRIPWIAYTDQEGPRIRTNIKVITSVKDFFDNEHGAFSGNPSVPRESEFRRQTFLNIMNDDQKDLKEAYYDFKFGRKILMKRSALMQGSSNPSRRQIIIKAYAVNTDNTKGDLLYAGNTVIYTEPKDIGRSKRNSDTDGLVFYGLITPNGDGINDVFYIKNIDNFTDNEIKIYDIYGNLVYECKSYGANNNFFSGSGNQNKFSKQLPEGTYFYSFQYLDSSSLRKERNGYLYISFI